jgi:hypothetical protein
MEQAALAAAAGVSVPTVKRLEKTDGPISANTGTEAAVRRALEAAGVIFIDENGEGPGVRLRKVVRSAEVSIRDARLVEAIRVMLELDDTAIVAPAAARVLRMVRAGDSKPAIVQELGRIQNELAGRVAGDDCDRLADVLIREVGNGQ